VLGWIMDSAFAAYRFTGSPEQELHLRLPVAPLLSCLQIFSDRASMTLRYPSGPSDEMHFTLEEEGAVTECRIQTLVLDEALAPSVIFFSTGEGLCQFCPKQPEVWHLALSEFVDLDAPDVVLTVTLCAVGDAAVVLRATTISSDAEVELRRDSLDTFDMPAEVAAAGVVSHRYHLTSVLASCLRAAKDAKAVKVRLNSSGIMSNQFVFRSRGQRDLYCEALVCPLTEANVSGGSMGGPRNMYGASPIPGANGSASASAAGAGDSTVY